MRQAVNKVDISPMIIGTMRLGEWGAKLQTNALQTFIEECIDLDLTTFDHADIYGNYTTEADFGKVLTLKPELRRQIQIITKCGINMVTPNRPNHRIKSYDSSAKHIIKSVENSLTALATDYIDVLLLHRPDYLMEPNEIAEAVNTLYRSGKIHAFGVSNFNTQQVALLQSNVPLFTNQVEASLLHLNAFEDGTLEQCMRLGIKPMAWSPFGGGLLFLESKSENVARIKEIAAPLLKKYEATFDQLMIAFLRRHPVGIIPVLGTTNIERVKSAKGAMKIELEREDWYDLLQASKGETIA